MEEARVDFMEKIGFPYKKMEEEGVISPIISVECKYIKTTTFDDVLEIETTLSELRPVKAIFTYDMKNKITGEIVATGRTISGFIDKDGKPMLANKIHPEFYELMAEYALNLSEKEKVK